MPLYLISHKDSISPAQRDELAAAITKTHSDLFTTPSTFVNVKFEDVSSTPYYVGGKAKTVNAIHAHVRSGPSRPRSSYNKLCSELRSAWEEIFSEKSIQLDLIFILGDIVAGNKWGFNMPEAGKDEEWAKENFGEFERRAENGDEEFKDLVGELRTRGLGV
ncbi:uncharacterized protein K452DRAFT_353898 [Aplosporella prunicola CBS 121167]|uniref:Tautomerase cis-CaaD-like domain-containing protein n=1 Tax=Aplosporella prunicola CBS 121167 TaxID=1176127 RepID=A0A6A6AZ66_9PEZI|nr:uncharacterized protein K452DRAFT_353898 [Aplosporella prunicola CBS 121167]KAF2136483.1 hypothetical protein K452DRAFT_353898 [Aplosporella prunicola CBS 121167]